MLRCFFVLIPALLVLCSTLDAGDAPGKVQITWHGQSFFEIKTTKGTIIVTDPHAIPEYGRVLGLKAPLVLISHRHNDHNRVEILDNAKDKDLKIIEGLTGPGRGDWAKVDEKFKNEVHVKSVST